MLGLRKACRSVPKPPRHTATQDLAPLLHPGDDPCSAPGALPVRQTPFRRRPTNENARRGESKLGRAAHLKPGRLTLPLPESIMPTIRKSRSRDPELKPTNGASLPGTHSAKEHEKVSREKGEPCTSTADANSSWDSDEHSLHSNLVHHEARQMKASSQSDLPPIKANATPESKQGHGAREEQLRDQVEESQCPLMDDFFSRNPAALTNGWLAMPHHRDDPNSAGRQDRSPAIRSAVRDLIQPNQPHLSGLVPHFSSNRRSRRK